MDILLLLWMFTVKHFLVDFVFQTAEEVEHKGTYLDYRGVKHSIKHAFGTLFVLLILGASFEQSWMYAAADFVIHYHIDWAKMNLNTYWQLHPLHHAKFWWLMGADQWAHQMTYLLLTLLVF